MCDAFAADYKFPQSVLTCIETNAYLCKCMMAVDIMTFLVNSANTDELITIRMNSSQYVLNSSQYGMNSSQYGMNSANTEPDYASYSNTGGKATMLLIGCLRHIPATTYTVN